MGHFCLKPRNAGGEVWGKALRGSDTSLGRGRAYWERRVWVGKGNQVIAREGRRRGHALSVRGERAKIRGGRYDIASRRGPAFLQEEAIEKKPPNLGSPSNPKRKIIGIASG